MYVRDLCVYASDSQSSVPLRKELLEGTLGKKSDLSKSGSQRTRHIRYYHVHTGVPVLTVVARYWWDLHCGCGHSPVPRDTGYTDGGGNSHVQGVPVSDGACVSG